MSITPILILISVLLFLPILFLLKGIRRSNPGAEKRTKNGKKLPIGVPPTPRELTGEERDQMLDDMRALAKENPERVADAVRRWMKED